MQNKFEQILIKENQFLNSLNFNTFGTANSLNMNYTNNNSKNNSNNNKYQQQTNVFMENMNYLPKQALVPDDEDVRKNISEQINFVKIFFFEIY